jgi:membrane associated rhomboid family serine protease
LDSVEALSGQWWRVFTAMLLHADLGHLLANATVGFLFFGLAMARHGPALGLLAAYLAGAAGNLAGLLLYPNPYQGMGASGMVMGALGLIAIPPRRTWSWGRNGVRQIARAALASVMLFILLGVDPTSDVIAHLGGFMAGAMFGFLLDLLPPRLTDGRELQRWAAILLALLVFATLGLAITLPRFHPR